MLSYRNLFFGASAYFFSVTVASEGGACSTGAVHRIFAGSTVANNGLHFEPENLVAEVGDIIEFHFLPKNHTVVQSSFDKPCEPLESSNGVFSRFNFATAQGEAPDVFTFTVKSKEPFWYYCSQTVGNHCQSGMSGVINQDFGSNNTLASYKERSKNSVTRHPSENFLASQGGFRQPRTPLRKRSFTGRA
jgi:plastocyanin